MALTLLRHASQKPPVGPLAFATGSALASKCVGLWLLNEYGSTVLNDVHGAQSLGTNGSDPAWSSGQMGPQLAYNAGDGKQQQLYAGHKLGGLTDWTIAAWARWPLQNSDRAVYCERASVGNDIVKLEIEQATQNLRLTWRNDAGTLTQFATTTPTDGNLHLIGATASGTNTQLWIDAVGGATGTLGTNSFTDASTQCWLGRDSADTSADWTGKIVMLALFNKALDTSDWQQLFGEPYAMVRPGPLRRWFVTPLSSPTPSATDTATLTEALNIAVKSSDTAGLTKEEAVVTTPGVATNVTKFANANTVVTTGWTNPTNAFADDGVYTTAAPAKNASITSDFGFPAFTTSDIPAGSTINSVTAEIQFKSDTTASTGATIGLQLNDNGTLQGSEQTAVMATVDTLLTHQVTTGISQSDLQTANFVKARVAGKRAGSNTTVTWSVDYVKLTVNYTPAPTTLVDAVNVNLTDSASETETVGISQTGNATTPSDADTATLSNTASNIGVSGPTDTSSASESGAIGFGTSDSTSLAEQNAIKLAQTDPAAFAEQVTLAASVNDTDMLTVVEAIKVALSSSDSGSLVEQLAIALAHQDTAALSDLVQIALAQSQSVTATDTASNIGLGQTESASTSESSTSVGLGTADSGSLTEQNAIALFHQDLATFTEQVAIAISTSDTASQSEQTIIAVPTSSSDSATLSETPGATAATGSQDSSSQTDQSSIGAATAASESSNLAEQLQLALQASENASLGEALAIALAHQDAAALQELVGLALGTADSAVFAEQVAIAVSTSASDTATLGESAHQDSPNKSDTDTATLSEQLQVALSATDGAGLAESLAIALARQDSATLQDLVAVAIAIADTAAASESATSTAQTTTSESGTLGESVNIATSAAELGALAEQLSVGVAPSADGTTLAEQVAVALQASPEGLAILEQYQVAVSSSAVDTAAVQDAVQQAIALATQEAVSLGEQATVLVGAPTVPWLIFVLRPRALTFSLLTRPTAFGLLARELTFTLRSHIP